MRLHPYCWLWRRRTAAHQVGLVPFPAPRGRGRCSGRGRAFTLIEVMIASGILFMCMFAVLAVLSNGLRNARALQRRTLDPGMAAAELYTQFMTTNRIAESSGSGDFGNVYPDYRYTYDLWEFSTNGLWQLDVVLHNRSGGQAEEARLSLLLFKRP